MVKVTAQTPMREAESDSAGPSDVQPSSGLRSVPTPRGGRDFAHTLAAALSDERKPTSSPPTGPDAELVAAAAALPHFYDLGWHRRLLDLTGGDGRWSIAATTMCPGLRATVLADPSAVSCARDRIAAAGVARRVQVVGRQLTEARIPSGYDVILLADDMHRRTPADNLQSLQRLRASANYGARLLLADPWTDNTSPHTLASISPATTRPPAGGETIGYQLEQIREWLRLTGWHFFWQAPLARPYSLVVADAA